MLSLSLSRKDSSITPAERKRTTVNMSNHDEEEPMEVQCSASSDAQQPLTNPDEQTAAEQTEDMMIVAKPADEAEVGVCLKWPADIPPPKCKMELQRVLQSWANKNKINADCNVLTVSTEGRRATIKIKPASALSELQKQTGQTLTKDGTTVTILSVHSLSKPGTDVPDLNSADVPTPLQDAVHPQDEEAQLEMPGSTANATENEFAYLPVGHFWYVSQIYREEMSRIGRENGGKLNAEVKVSFQVEQKDGNRNKALSEFTDLVQKCLGDSCGFTTPLNDAHPEEWKDTLKIIQRKESKLVLTVSSEDITVCGPRDSQEAMRRSLNITQTTNTNKSVSESASAWRSNDAPPMLVAMTIKDPLVDAGLTMKESHWKMMTASPSKKIASIKKKFGVDFKESQVSQGKINVKACSTNVECASMLSHALRALLRLYQKVTTLPKELWAGSDQADGEEDLRARNSIHHGFKDDGKNGTMENQEMNDLPMEGGATAGNSVGEKNEDNCPICLGPFTDKMRLKCSHEFCSECIANSKKALGPICPLCKNVFGRMEGDQPPGNMRKDFNQMSLPGFPHCGTIVITYDIHGGHQTEKHPNPGGYFSSITRTAYLPDNKEGQEVLRLLKRAFNQKLIFTIGTSRTTGRDNQVTWNDIHHKTSRTGGPENFGYPDPSYLSRVKEELKAKGIE